MSNQNPKPIPIGGPAVAVAIAAAVIGAVGLGPTAVGWLQAARAQSAEGQSAPPPPFLQRVPPKAIEDATLDPARTAWVCEAPQDFRPFERHPTDL